jgi:hypothetical protein
MRNFLRNPRFCAGALVLLLGLLGGTALSAQSAEVSRKIRVNLRQRGVQFFPDVAVAAAKAGFVVSWQEWCGQSGDPCTQSGADAPALFIRAFFLPHSWPTHQVNQSPIGNGFTSALATAPDGRSVVVWASSPQGVFARLVDSLGTPVGDEIPVAVPAGAGPWLPDVAMRPDGAFAVTWISAPGGPDNVFVRLFHADGTPAQEAQQVNAAPYGFRDRPSVAFDGSGAFLVTWCQCITFGAGKVDGRIYKPDGTPRTPVFEIPGRSGVAPLGPVAAGLPGSGFDVVWGEAPVYSITLRQIDGSGAVVGPAVRVAHANEPSITSISADADENGQVTIAWQQGTGASYQFLARRYNRSNKPASILLNLGGGTDSLTSGPRIVAGPQGSHLLVWQGPDADSLGVFFRSFAFR